MHAFGSFFLVFGGTEPTISYWTSTAWPLSRTPVFFMGMVAGFHRLKFPYPRLDADALELLRNQWAAFADRITLQMAAITILYAVLNLVVPWTRIGVPGPPMGLFAQLFLPSQMVYLTLALTLDGGHSVVGRYLRKAATQWLGQVSFALYLVHFPVMQMVGFITRGRQQRANHAQRTSQPAWNP